MNMVRNCFLWNRPASMIIVVVTLSFLPAISTQTSAQTRCAELLARLGSEQEDLKVSGRDFRVNGLDTMRIDAVRKQMQELNGDASVVVYFPVVTSDGIVNLRMENVRAGEVTVTVAGVTHMNVDEFSGLLAMAREPHAEYIRSVLQRDLMPQDSDEDKGKLVFFKDMQFHGLLPQLFNRRDGYVLSSSSLPRAVRNVRGLLEAKPTPDAFSAFVGFPETVDDFTYVFGTRSNVELDKWKMAADRFLNVSQDFGVNAYTAATIGNLETKEKLLHTLEDSRGIVFIVAHAAGCRVMLPGSVNFTLTPTDIRKCTLKHSPFVLLRICHGEDTGFAPAFLNAGASGVWMNTGRVGAETTTQEVQTFLESLRGGNTVGEAIRQTQERYPFAQAATGLFAQYSRPAPFSNINTHIEWLAIRNEHNN